MQKKIETSKGLEKNKGGRPPIVLTDEQIKELEDMAAYFTIEQIADYFDISEKCLYDLRHRNNEVFTAYKKGRMRKIYRYAKTLENKAFGMSETEISKCDTASIIFYLKTQAGWSEKKDLNVTTEDVTPKMPPQIIFEVHENPKNQNN